MAVRASARRLSRREFARALRLGLGRARIDARRHGLRGRADLLVARCLRSPEPDPWLYGSGESWLLDVARDGGVTEAVRHAILKRSRRRFARAGDAWQAADFLSLWARDGDAAAGRALLGMVDLHPPGTRFGAIQAVHALRAEGWLHVARSFGRRASQAADLDFNYLYSSASEHVGVRRALALLRSEAARDPAVRPFLDGIEEAHRESRKPRAEPVEDGSLAALERWIASTGRTWYFAVQRWARAATPADRRRAIARLAEEEDSERLRRRILPWQGLKRPPKELLPALLPHLAHADRRVRIAAASAAGAFRDPRLRTMALRRLRSDPRAAVDDGILDLLERNAESGDASAVLAALPGRGGKELLHDWTRGVAWIAKPRRGAEWEELLVRAWEVSPCRQCREFVLTDLVRRSAAPKTLLRESLLDAEEHTRRAAREGLRALRKASRGTRTR